MGYSNETHNLLQKFRSYGAIIGADYQPFNVYNEGAILEENFQLNNIYSGEYIVGNRLTASNCSSRGEIMKPNYLKLILAPEERHFLIIQLNIKNKFHRKMANTYTQLIIQLVFAVKHRDAMIHESIRQNVEKYMAGIIKNNNHVLLAQYCMPDHCHILVGLNPVQSISELAKEIKANSSRWINENKIIPFRFNWQEGYGAFSYSKSQLDVVVKYILNQKEHHKGKTFRQEYLEFLQKFNIDFDERYLFEWIE